MVLTVAWEPSKLTVGVRIPVVAPYQAGHGVGQSIWALNEKRVVEGTRRPDTKQKGINMKRFNAIFYAMIICFVILSGTLMGMDKPEPMYATLDRNVTRESSDLYVFFPDTTFFFHGDAEIDSAISVLLGNGWIYSHCFDNNTPWAVGWIDTCDTQWTHVKALY